MNRPIFVVFVLICLLLPLDAVANEFFTTPAARQHWTSAEGLPQDTVLAIIQDDRGYLWLGTEAGLARFDGVRFQVFDQHNTPALASDLILSLAEDRSGTLWIGTSGGGLHRLRNGRVQRCAGKLADLGHNVYALAAAPDGTLWVGTERGLSQIHEDEVRAFKENDGVPEAPVYSIAVQDQTVWFGTYGRGLGRWEDDRATLWTTHDGLPDDRVVTVNRLEEDLLMVSCYGGEVVAVTSAGFRRYRPVAKYPDNRGIWAVSSLPGGGVAIGSFGAGLGVIEGHSYRFLGPDVGVSSATVWSLFRDRADDLWAGTSDGLFRFRSLPIRSLVQADGLPGVNISSVWRSKANRLFVGTDAGLLPYSFPGEKQKRLRLVTAQHVVSLAEDPAGQLWMGTTDRGLWRVARLSAVAKRIPGPWASNPIHAVAVVPGEDGREEKELWVGTFGAGLFSCRNLEAEAIVCSPVRQVRDPSIMSILVGRNGALFIGTRNGLDIYEKAKWRHLGKVEGLQSADVAALFEDSDENLWIGTEKGGLGRLRNGRIDWSNIQSGLPDNSIYSILEDGQGRLWMGSTKGIFRMRKSEFPANSNRPLNAVLYGLGDGLLSTLCSEDTPNAAARTDDGVLWFGTTKGLAKIDPSLLHESRDPPPVYVEQVRLDGEIAPNVDKGVSAAPGTRHLEIAYTALDLSMPEKQIFRYRMDGFDDRWIDGGSVRLASYTNLPAGHYRFTVQARSGSGIWNVRGAQISLRVRPHFYATTWFLSLAALALGLLVFALYLLRVRVLRREFAAVLAERMRSVRAQEQITAAHISELARMNIGLRDNLTVLSSGTELKIAMEQLLATAVEQLRADNACIFVYDEATGTLERLFAAGDDIPADGPLRDAYFASCPASLEAKRLSIWQHFQSDKNLLLLDLDNELDAAMLWPEAIRWHREIGHPAAVALPLFLGSRMLGLMGINFIESLKDLSFNDERKNLANSLGSLASMALESQRLALRARDAAIGEERARLSEEMHDGIQQLFTAISFQLGGVQNMARTGQNSADLLPQIQRTAEIAEHGLREVRRSIRALHDAAPLSERELVDALKGLCRSSESAQLRCELQVSEDLHLPTSARLNDLYRVAQEAVNNACKHANAGRIEVRLEGRGTTLTLSITDNGRGFDPDSAQASGNGMRNLAERARRLHGKLMITSTPGATRIVLVVPDMSVL